MRLDEYLDRSRRMVEEALEGLLPLPEGPAATVVRAMRYAVFAGGKRLRPTLVLAACEACGGALPPALPAAAAVELVHTYSLIHDDLPAMDDDDLRRGRPTVHRAFGDAAAILAGDGLLTLAFEILATRPEGDAWAARRSAALATIARGAGIEGMVGGQIADLEAEKRPADSGTIRWIHLHKTGALLAACAETGAILAGAAGEDRAALARYGRSVGLGFQIADDLLDRTASPETLGKTPGKDLESGKATYPSVLGVDASRDEADRTVRAALGEVERFGAAAEPLRAIARYAVSRSH